MLTPQQIAHITDNLNYLVEQANYDVKVTFEHKLWWLQGFNVDPFDGGSVVVGLINVDNDDESFDDKDITQEELQSMAAEVLAQVNLGAQ